MRFSLNPDVETHRQRMVAKIEAEAASFRHQFIPLDRAVIYFVKEQEARAFQANANAVVPHIAAEATARGITVAEAAQLVTTAANSWRQLSARIEGLRVATKRAIEAAKTVAEIRTASSPDYEATKEGNTS